MGEGAAMPGRTLLFLPGAGADPDFWRPVGDRLPAAWDRRYFGWPGLGDQPADPAVNRFDDLVDRVEAAIDGAPVDLLAQSMGGVVAMKLAIRRPEAVRRMVLTVTSGGIDMAGLGAEDWRPAMRAAFPGAAPWLYAERSDLSAQLAKVTCPVLLLWGDADPISPVAVGERLRALLPNARLAVLRGGTHDLVQERADEAAALIAEHLA